MVHMLSGCEKALTQERHRWHHDKVLMTIANTLEQVRRKKHQIHGKPTPSIKVGREKCHQPQQEYKKKQKTLHIYKL